MQGIKEFAQTMSGIISNQMGKDYKVETHVVEKINIGKLHTIVIKNNKNNVSPNFYLDEFYSSYISGKCTLTELADRIISKYHNLKDMFPGNETLAVHISEKSWVKERLFLQLINSGRNKSFLDDAVYSDRAGLSLVLYVLVGDDNNGTAKIKVTKSMCRNFGWNEMEILDYALVNTMELFPLEICSIGKILSRLLNMEAEDIQMPDSTGFSFENSLMVLTNKRGIYGAAAVFYPGALKEFAEKKGTNLFLIPSSIHEFMVVGDNGLYNPENLEKMLEEVNSTEVAPEEILSDSLYYYDYKSRELSVLNTDIRETVIL